MQDEFNVKRLRQEFGAVIRKRRVKLGLSQEVFAEKADIHRTYVSGIELGKRDVGISVGFKLARALKTTLSKLIKITEDQKNPL